MSRRSWAELLLLAALWGAVYLLIEITLRELHPVVVVFVRVLLAALLLTPLAIRRHALGPLWRHPRAIVETVLVQATIPLLLLTSGQRYVASGVAAILIGAQPLFVALLAIRLAPDERPQGWVGALGILLGLAGLLFLFGIDLRSGRTTLVGGLLVLTAALCYAGGAIMIHRRHSDAQPLGVATSAMLVSTGVLVIPAWFSLPGNLPSPTTSAAAIVLGVVCTGMSLVLFYRLIAVAGPARAALAFYLSPAFAAVLGIVILDERVGLGAIAGLVCIVAGSVLAARRAEPAPV